MDAEEIERYLAELGAELKNRGIKKPVRVLLIGGAYMLLLANAPRSTKDIDIFWLDGPPAPRPLRPALVAVPEPPATLPGSCRPSALHPWKRAPACRPKVIAKK